MGRRIGSGYVYPDTGRWNNLLFCISLFFSLFGWFLPGIFPVFAVLSLPFMPVFGMNIFGSWHYGFPLVIRRLFGYKSTKDYSPEPDPPPKRYVYDPKINPAVFKKEEAEARARKYHKQKGQFLEIVKKTKKGKTYEGKTYKGLTADETWEKWIKDAKK